jgi:hypothetical protein
MKLSSLLVFVLALAGCSDCPAGDVCTTANAGSEGVQAPGSAVNEFLGTIEDCRVYTVRDDYHTVVAICPHSNASSDSEYNTYKDHHSVKSQSIRGDIR